MKIKALIVLLALVSLSALAQYHPVDKRSTVAFTIKNLGFNVKGSFTGLQGTITFDPQSPALGNMDVTIDANTVNTNNSSRDNHLKEESYFDTKNYPTIKFVSSQITGSNGNYTVTGKLTIKGKTKEITFPFTATPGTEGMTFTGSFKINRKDFDVGGTSIISNELEVKLNVLAAKT